MPEWQSKSGRAFSRLTQTQQEIQSLYGWGRRGRGGRREGGREREGGEEREEGVEGGGGVREGIEKGEGEEGGGERYKMTRQVQYHNTM